MKSRKSAISPFAEEQRRRFQFSLRTIFMLMCVFAIATTTITLGLRTPEIAREVSMWTGVTDLSKGSSSRFSQLMFSIFCYTAPLMLALFVQIFLKSYRFYLSRRERYALETPADPFADD